MIQINVVDEMRRRRETECFPVINRGRLWYSHLTIEQYNELNDWYHAWLDAPETLVVPSMPNWINDKLEREEILY